MGLYLRFLRPGKVLECSVVGFVLILLSIYAGKLVGSSAVWSSWFTWGGVTLAFAIMAYGFLASALPVWLLLAGKLIQYIHIRLFVETGQHNFCISLASKLCIRDLFRGLARPF